MSHHAAPDPPWGFDDRAPQRRRWPVVSGGLIAGLVVIALVVVFLVRRDDPAAGLEPPTAPLVPADGVTAGGELSGQARALADALTQRGLECSVRFTAPEGGQTGCFAVQDVTGTTVEAIFQHHPDGSVIGLNLKVNGPKYTRGLLRSLIDIAGPVVFPADHPAVIDIFNRAFAGFPEGSWGDYHLLGHGAKTYLSASKRNITPIKVPVLHLDTTEPQLADALRADGFTCTGDNETCTGQPAMALKFSGPDTGITYLVATATNGATTPETFNQLRIKVFAHLRGNAVGPVFDWVGLHLGGPSRSAFVAGWRVDLVVSDKQIRLTLFNEETWLVPE
ncbi:hypothetical protein [Kribbella sp. NPDC023855]|uniref:hypothetical protein n=1 Tax=Kribbella sp. NPDC023855 TaxID=3154698 RepID=UPI0033DB2988